MLARHTRAQSCDKDVSQVLGSKKAGFGSRSLGFLRFGALVFPPLIGYRATLIQEENRRSVYPEVPEWVSPMALWSLLTALYLFGPLSQAEE